MVPVMSMVPWYKTTLELRAFLRFLSLLVQQISSHRYLLTRWFNRTWSAGESFNSKFLQLSHCMQGDSVIGVPNLFSNMATQGIIPGNIFSYNLSLLDGEITLGSVNFEVVDYALNLVIVALMTPNLTPQRKSHYH